MIKPYQQAAPGLRILLIRKDDVHIESRANLVRAQPDRGLEFRDRAARFAQGAIEDNLGRIASSVDDDLLAGRTLVSQLRTTPLTHGPRCLMHSPFRLLPAGNGFRFFAAQQRSVSGGRKGGTAQAERGAYLRTGHLQGRIQGRLSQRAPAFRPILLATRGSASFRAARTT